MFINSLVRAQEISLLILFFQVLTQYTKSSVLLCVYFSKYVFLEFKVEFSRQIGNYSNLLIINQQDSSLVKWSQSQPFFCQWIFFSKRSVWCHGPYVQLYRRQGILLDHVCSKLFIQRLVIQMSSSIQLDTIHKTDSKTGRTRCLMPMRGNVIDVRCACFDRSPQSESLSID